MATTNDPSRFGEADGATARDAAQALGAGMSAAADQVKRGVDGAKLATRQAAADLGAAAGDAAERLADRAHDALDDAGDTASDYAARLTDASARAVDGTRDAIVSSPLRSLALAALAGYLLVRAMG